MLRQRRLPYSADIPVECQYRSLSREYAEISVPLVD